MAANEQVLGALHVKVAEVLTDLLDGTDLPTGEQDDDGNAIVQKLQPSAAVLTSAIQFLKNNNITCVASDTNALGALVDKQKAREATRLARKEAMKIASQDMSFMQGMPN